MQFCSERSGYKALRARGCSRVEEPIDWRLFRGEGYCLHTQQTGWCSVPSVISGGRVVNR